MSAIAPIANPIAELMMAPPIQPVSVINPPQNINGINEASSPFSSFFDAAMNVVRDTNVMQLEADQLQMDFATGRIDDILAVQLSQDRAMNALNFTVQITNRVIEAYREIMRMQI